MSDFSNVTYKLVKLTSKEMEWQKEGTTYSPFNGVMFVNLCKNLYKLWHHVLKSFYQVPNAIFVIILSL